MRKLLLSVATVALLGLTSAAWAQENPQENLQNNPQDTSLITAQEALAMARNIGVVSLKELEFYEDTWEIEGNDPDGKDIAVNVDATTGAIIKVDRW